MDKTIYIKIWTMSENTEPAALLMHYSYSLGHNCSLVIDAGETMCIVWSHTTWVLVHASENSTIKDTVVIQNTFWKPCVYKCVTKSASQY